MRKRFAGSVAVRMSWFSTICVVLLADIYDPTLNPLYQHLRLHYGVVAMPCRRKRVQVLHDNTASSSGSRFRTESGSGKYPPMLEFE
jgi:hypothetical protein